MPDTPCVHCGTVGFVRRERVVNGDVVAIDYSCGRCLRSWTQPDAGRRVDLQRPTKPDRRKHVVRLTGDEAGKPPAPHPLIPAKPQ
jgi:hypothetical protein